MFCPTNIGWNPANSVFFFFFFGYDIVFNDMKQKLSEWVRIATQLFNNPATFSTRCSSD
jgi:hypothetical protein